jgi:hypothetical protein
MQRGGAFTEQGIGGEIHANDKEAANVYMKGTKHYYSLMTLVPEL